MDELDELRDLLSDGERADPDESPPDASAPLDGAPLEDGPDADEELGEGDDLSPEDRVAALLRDGTEDEDEDESDDDAADGEDEAEETDEAELAALLEEGRRYRAEREQQAQLAPYAEVYQQAESRLATAKTHFRTERRRIAGLVLADADASADREAYLATHFDAAIQGVIDAEEAWTTQVAADARQSVQRIREQQSRPAWAAHLANERHLPKEAIGRILQVEDPRQMPIVADMLVEARNALAKERRRRTLAERNREAKRIAANQVHPGATGRPRAGKPVELTGSMDELKAILKA